MGKKKQVEPVVCSYCPEDAINETVEDEIDGWESTEFGMKCPECRFIREADAPGSSMIGLNPEAEEAKRG